MGRADPYIHDNVERVALDDSAELGLRMVQLVVESPQSVFDGGREVILDKGIANSDLGKSAAVIGFQEKAT